MGMRPKVCTWHLGHMTKMTAIPIYGTNPSKIFYGNSGLISTKVGIHAHYSLFKIMTIG